MRWLRPIVARSRPFTQASSTKISLTFFFLNCAEGEKRALSLTLPRAYKKRLREGVVRDLERQIRKQENLRLLEEQIVLTRYLESEREKTLESKEYPKSKQV
ncbi:protein PET117 homolog, mitochondrial isoform X1 [Microcaecilia unicolor]|uniref:Protein PET117 homolog, mitochondrial isoform X1 n=1 Tax=Microcaecilia unicolor TaxID=1415580 RepID=A0A6P7XN88_9AMPH|nr:protein PET117 homolog, mitochondrial isoform X1 [Microcaecilia unicolor]